MTTKTDVHMDALEKWLAERDVSFTLQGGYFSWWSETSPTIEETHEVIHHIENYLNRPENETLVFLVQFTSPLPAESEVVEQVMRTVDKIRRRLYVRFTTRDHSSQR